MPRRVVIARRRASLRGAVLVLASCRLTLPEDPVVIEIPFYVKDTALRDEAQDATATQEEELKFLPPEGMGEAFRKNKVPKECFGARVNLHQTRACRCQGIKEVPGVGGRISYCGDAFYEEVDLTDAIDVRLVPYAETVAVGEFVRIDLVMKNRTDAVLPIMLGYAFMYDLCYDAVRVVNADGVDVTRKGHLAGGSRGGEVLFALEPGGEARMPMKWSPVTIVGEGSDDPPSLSFRTEKLPPGEYTLSFKVPFYYADKVTDAQRAPSAKITVLPEKAAPAGDVERSGVGADVPAP